jgi:hypothetical protein
MALDMVNVASGNQVLLEHLMANFCHAQGNKTKVVAELQSGLHNPIGPNRVFFYQLKMDKGLASNNTWTFWLVGISQLQKNYYH